MRTYFQSGAPGPVVRWKADPIGGGRKWKGERGKWGGRGAGGGSQIGASSLEFLDIVSARSSHCYTTQAAGTWSCLRRPVQILNTPCTYLVFKMSIKRFRSPTTQIIKSKNIYLKLFFFRCSGFSPVADVLKLFQNRSHCVDSSAILLMCILIFGGLQRHDCQFSLKATNKQRGQQKIHSAILTNKEKEKNNGAQAA